MSQPYPPSGQQPGGNPFAQQQDAAGGFPPPAPGGFDGAGYPPPAPPAPVRGNTGLGIVVGVVAMLAAAAAYGGIIKATEHEIGYAALAVGALVGAALGKVGGRNPVLPVVGVPLALLGVYLGQLFGIALLVSATSGAPDVVTIFTDHLGDLQSAWKSSLDVKDVLFFGIAGLEGFLFAKRLGG